jgi:hypothetical protein
LADTTVQTAKKAELASRIEAGSNFNIRTLEPGRWYCIGFKVVHDSGMEGDDFGRILKLDSIEEDAIRARGVWVDEDGDVIESVFDPGLQLECHPDGADFFVVQS